MSPPQADTNHPSKTPGSPTPNLSGFRIADTHDDSCKTLCNNKRQLCFSPRMQSTILRSTTCSLYSVCVPTSPHPVKLTGISMRCPCYDGILHGLSNQLLMPPDAGSKGRMINRPHKLVELQLPTSQSILKQNLTLSWGCSPFRECSQSLQDSTDAELNKIRSRGCLPGPIFILFQRIGNGIKIHCIRHDGKGNDCMISFVLGISSSVNDISAT